LKPAWLLLIALLAFRQATAQLCFAPSKAASDPGYMSQAITAGDFNGDGKTDLVMVGLDAVDSITVYVGDGLGNFPATIKTQQSGHELFTADFNSDGKPDLAIVNDTMIDVLLGIGNGHFSPTTHIPMHTSSLVGVTGADFNNDGRTDIVTSSHLTAALLVMQGDGAGGFSAPVAYPTAPFPMYATAADINGDGRPDLLCSSETADSIAILINGSNGKFFPTRYLHHSRSAFVKTADINADGKIDLVARTGVFSADSIRISYGDGTGQFPAKAATYAAGTGVREMVIADLDNDGQTDIAATNSNGNGTVVVLKGTGSHGFNAPLQYATQQGFPYFLLVTDLNNDTKKDLVTATAFFSGTQTTYREIFMNCGPTSIGNKALAASFRLYPNPAADRLTLELSSVTAETSLQLLDIMGRCLKHQDLLPGTTQLVTADLPDGMYMIRIASEENAVSEIITIRH
jgi:hypothetical protein